MKTNRLLIVLVLLAALLLAGCSSRVRVGDLQTKLQTIELGDVDSVNVEIQTGADELDVSGGASELLEASFTYNVEELNPRATYADGRLEVKDSGVSIGIGSLADLAEYRSKWDLKLNEEVPMVMNIKLGLGPSHLALGALALTRLNIGGGAGEVTIDLTGDWHHDLDARIEAGLGDIHLTLPGDVGARIEVDPGVGDVNANGLTRDGNTYTNDAYGVSDVTLRLHMDGGVGDINLDIE